MACCQQKRKYVILDKKLFLALPFMVLGYVGNEVYHGIRAENAARITTSVFLILACLIPCWIFRSAGGTGLRKPIHLMAIFFHLCSLVAGVTELILYVQHYNDAHKESAGLNSTVNTQIPSESKDTVLGNSTTVHQNISDPETWSQLSSPLILVSGGVSILMNTWIGISSQVFEVPKENTTAADEGLPLE